MKKLIRKGFIRNTIGLSVMETLQGNLHASEKKFLEACEVFELSVILICVA